MPHAILPQSSLGIVPQQSKLQRALPPLPRGPELMQQQQKDMNPMNRASTLLPPPRSVDTAAANGMKVHSQQISRTMGLGWEGVASSNSQKGPYLATSAPQTSSNITSTARTHSGPPSPSSSQRPSYEIGHRRKTSSNAITPNLQTPKTIDAPQAGLPQLAAEVMFHVCFPKE
jgi:hypothetical protein